MLAGHKHGTPLIRSLQHFLRPADGMSTTEYAVMLALILIVMLNAVQTIGCVAKLTFISTAESLDPNPNP